MPQAHVVLANVLTMLKQPQPAASLEINPKLKNHRSHLNFLKQINKY